MPNQIQSPNVKNKYDLMERTGKFGEQVIIFDKEIPENTITRPLISQLIRSVTSIGANYMEADCAESKKDFVHKIGICKKESKESTYWFRMLSTAFPTKKETIERFRQEAHELTLIFSAIVKKR